MWSLRSGAGGGQETYHFDQSGGGGRGQSVVSLTPDDCICLH